MNHKDLLRFVLNEMSGLYGQYASKLADWINKADEIEDKDILIAELSEMELNFINKARAVGLEAENLRMRLSKEFHRGMKLYDLASEFGLESELEDASAAVHRTAVLRTKALREVEKIRNNIGKEIEKIGSALRLKKRYNLKVQRGRKIDGRS